MNFFKTLNTAINQVIESSKKRFDFENISYLPRWLILLFDITICFAALLITEYIIFNVAGGSFDLFKIGKSDVAIVATNLFFFLILRTYAGLIRHSTFIDAVKFFLASSATFVSLLIINFCFKYLGYSQFTSIAKLVVYFSISFSFLFLFRVFVKQVYEILFVSTNGEVESVLIYGDGANAIAIANALKAERPMRYRVIGFVNSDQKNQSKQILGLPILSSKKKCYQCGNACFWCTIIDFS